MSTTAARFWYRRLGLLVAWFAFGSVTLLLLGILGFSPDAPPLTLLRRAHLDLTGLPPTEEETKAFLADTKPGAFAQSYAFAGTRKLSKQTQGDLIHG